MGKKKGFIAEFKEFISRGNVVDMAVGIIIGTAFTAIVNSLVKEIIMPIVGFLIGGIDFSEFKFVLAEATEEVPEVAILYGNFIQQVVNFLIIAFTVFVMVKSLNMLRRKLERKKEEIAAAEPPAPPAADIVLLTEIRDLLKTKENEETAIIEEGNKEETGE